MKNNLIVGVLANFLKDNPKWAKTLQLVLAVLFVGGILVEGIDLPEWLAALQTNVAKLVELVGMVVLQYPNAKPDYE